MSWDFFQPRQGPRRMGAYPSCQYFSSRAWKRGWSRGWSVQIRIEVLRNPDVGLVSNGFRDQELAVD